MMTKSRAPGSETYKCTVSCNSSRRFEIPLNSRIPRSLNVGKRFVNGAAAIDGYLDARSPNYANRARGNIVTASKLQQLGLSSRRYRHDHA